MLKRVATRVRRKAQGAYHHGDLEHALVQAALRTIREEGVQAVTLRGVGAKLGVSRTALYRHFAHKEDLLARVALEGFKLLHAALLDGDTGSAADSDRLGAMGKAYVRFAMQNRSHYQTMFGGFVEKWSEYAELTEQADATFRLLVQAIAGEQQTVRVIPGDPVKLAQVTWSLVHGVATLGMAGHFCDVEETAVLACEVLRTGLLPR